MNKHNSLGLPGALLISLGSLVALSGLLPGAVLADPSPQIVKISAKRFEYTPSQVTVKKNIPVVLQLTTLDRSHGIAIPALNLRSDIPPGKVTELKFTPVKSGDLKFYCDVFCGDGHDDMAGTIKVID